jgi:mRNA interferase MazF
MEKDFDRWNKIKKHIENNKVPNDLFINVGEVWMMNMGLNIGHEQNGGGKDFSRPGLIIKKFNRNMFLILPLSTKQKSLDFYFNFKDPFDREVAVILAQIKLCSVKRLRRKLYEVTHENLQNITLKLKDLL